MSRYVLKVGDLSSCISYCDPIPLGAYTKVSIAVRRLIQGPIARH